MLRLRLERLRRGWNQTALAFHAEMSAPEVSRIETARMRPYPSQMEKLSRALGLDPEVLLQEMGEADAAELLAIPRALGLDPEVLLQEMGEADAAELLATPAAARRKTTSASASSSANDATARGAGQGGKVAD